MEGSTENASIATTSPTAPADPGDDKTLDVAEPALSPQSNTMVPPDQGNSLSSSSTPGLEAAIETAAQGEQTANGAQTTLELVSNSIKQVAEGLGEISAVVQDIRDSVKSKAEAKNPRRKLREPGGYLEEEKRLDDIAKLHEEDDIRDLQKQLPPPKRVIPESRFCNWAEFYDSYRGDHSGFCIEALRASDNLKSDKPHKSLDVDVDKAEAESRDPSDRNLGHWIQKVRVQSRTITKLLSSFSEAKNAFNLNETPLVFHRPFRLLIHSQDQMKGELERLEKEFSTFTHTPKAEEVDGLGLREACEVASSDEVRSDAQPANESNIVGESKEKTTMDSADTLQSSKQKLEEVRCYVEFIDTHIMPMSNMFDPSDALKSQRVRYQDLWHLFKLGDYIYQPPLKSNSAMAGSGQSRASTTKQTIWRIYRIQSSYDTRSNPDEPWDTNSTNETWIWGYYIDFDGVSFGAVARRFIIDPYEGERDITKLPYYPLKYVKDAEEILKSAREDGANFKALIEDKKKYGTHSGWTLTDDPDGNFVESVNSEGEKITLSPEHVESDVMFDFNEAFNFYPSWTPKLIVEGTAPAEAQTRRDYRHLIHHWSDEDHTKLLGVYYDYTVSSDAVSDLEFNRFLEHDQYLVVRDTKQALSDDDLTLLPKRMFGYALWERKFVLVNVRNVERKLEDDKDNPFDKLEINKKHKKMIQAIISSYFANKSLEDEIRAPMSQDIIRNKGKGVVILLHGVPGVGKTATAEAVAHKWNKPLFPITCGDLGDTAATVEKKLNDIFRFAHLWECVLLLDEADVFITHRSNDLKRNALVSVFLRMLEYYNGILFLTTNRPGVLDEAVKSRVHLSLRYEALTLDQTTAIFKINIERLKKIEEQRNNAEILRDKKGGEKEGAGRKLAINKKSILAFAEEHFNKHDNDVGRWNGRQIRNAFSIAASLAHFDSDDDPDLPRLLSAEQFRHVHEATLLYDRYRQSALGKKDGEMAHARGERNDDHDEDDSPPSKAGK